MRSLASNLASLTDLSSLIILLRMLTSSSFEILTMNNVFRLSPRRWQRSDRSGMTEMETGAWISAQGQHKSGKSLRSAPVGLRTKMWTCSSSRASWKIEETVQFSFAFHVFDFEFRRNSVNSERHLSEFKRAQLQYVDGSVESSHLEEVEV